MKNKSPELIATLDRIFPGIIDCLENHLCVTCNKPINEADFKDTRSEAEYEISGMCQLCQDNMFEREDG